MIAESILLVEDVWDKLYIDFRNKMEAAFPDIQDIINFSISGTDENIEKLMVSSFSLMRFIERKMGFILLKQKRVELTIAYEAAYFVMYKEMYKENKPSAVNQAMALSSLSFECFMYLPR